MSDDRGRGTAGRPSRFERQTSPDLAWRSLGAKEQRSLRAPQRPAPTGSPRLSALALALIALVVLRGGSCLRAERPYAPPDADAVAAALQRQNLQVRSLRAETRMSHKTAEGRVKATVRLMAERGGKLRFDAVSPFDTPLSTLVSDGSRFALVDAKANRHYYGPASPCNLARLLQVQLPADTVITVLAGSAPLIGFRKAHLEWDERAGQEVLTLQGEGKTQVIRLDPRTAGGKPAWDLRSSEIRAGSGQVLLQIVASDYQWEGRMRVPQRLEVRQPELGNALDVVFKKRELNIELPAAAFELPEPAGLPSQYVDCDTPITR